MHTGKAKYVLDYCGPRIEKLQFRPNVAHVRSACIEAIHGNQLSIHLCLEDVGTEDEGEEFANRCLETIASRVAFRLDAYLGGVIRSSISLEGTKSLGRKTQGIAYSILQGHGDLDEESRDELKSELEKTATRRESLFGLYRLAFQAKDEVAQFMFLYNILLQIFGDNQCRVDRFIECRDGRSDWEDSPHTGEPESPFTRLRNEVGHKRKGMKPNFLRIRSEMKELLRKLQGHVKAAILQRTE